MAEDAWAESAQTWDDDAVVRAYADAAHTALLGVLDQRGLDLASLRVLDFGCGTGLLTAKLAAQASAVLGVDASPAMLQRLQAKIDAAGWSHVRAASQLPTDEAFDLVVASSVLAFIDPLAPTLRALASALKPGGVLVQWDWEAESDDAEFGLTRSAIEAAYRDAELEQVSLGIGFQVDLGDTVMKPLMGVAMRPRP